MENKREVSIDSRRAKQVSIPSSISFWKWFIVGSGARPGFRRLINRWLVIHLGVGIAISIIIPIDLQSAASAVLLPLAGVLVGLSFAWAGNAQALLQTGEIEALSEHHPGGFVEYVYFYSLAILCILVTLSVWGLAGLKIFDGVWPTSSHTKTYFGIKLLLFTLSSLTLRECWHIVLAAQWMLLTRREISRSRSSSSDRNEN